MSLRSGMWAVCFTDLVGSTEQRARLGDHTGDALRREHDRIVTRVAAAHDGIVVKGTGDGAMLAFASAAGAIAAAVAIQQGIERHNREAPEPLGLRVGISLGDVVHDDGDLHGLAANEAARVCALAAEGQILITELTRAVAGSRTTEQLIDHGEHTFKGIPEPVHVWKVDWAPAPEPERLPLPPMLVSSDAMAFAGRTRELDTLLDEWEAAAAGTRRLVLISGEPGIGKTRLAAETARRAYDRGGVVLYGRCDDELGVAFQPFTEALDWYVTRADEPSLGDFPGDLARICPRVTRGLTSVAPPLPADPQTEQYRLFEAVASWLTELSRTTPLVLVLDDLHWATKPTLLMLRHVLRTLDGRALVIGTYRDTDLDRGHPFGAMLADLRRLPGVERLPLGGFDLDETVQLLRGVGNQGAEDDLLGLARALAAETEGNPFFIGEVLRHLVETGGLAHDDGRWTIPVALADLGIPEGVREVLGQRLDRLGPEVGEALRCAAVVGRDFDVGTVIAASGAAEDAVVGAIDRATGARLVEDLGHDRCRFAHALVQTTLLEELTTSRRLRLHRRIAEHLEAGGAEAATIAHHWLEAGPSGDANHVVRVVLAAASDASERFAFADAAQLLQRATDVVVDAAVEADLERELAVSLGVAQQHAGDPACRRTLLDAARAAEAATDGPRLARAMIARSGGWVADAMTFDHEHARLMRHAIDLLAPDADADRAALMHRLARELTFVDPEEARRLAADALTVARRVGDLPLIRGCAGTFLGSRWCETDAEEEVISALSEVAHAAYPIAIARGDLPAASAMLEDEAAQFATRPFAPERSVLLSARTALAHLGGHLDEAVVANDHALDFNTTTGRSDAFAYWIPPDAVIGRDQGRASDLVETLTQVAAAIPPGTDVARYVTALLALLLTDVRRTDDAQSLLDTEAAAGFPAASRRTNLSLVYTVNQGDVAATLDDRAAAEELRGRLAPYSGRLAFDLVVALGAVDRTLGRLATVVGDFPAAERLLASAADDHARWDAPLWLARTWADQAALCLRRNGAGDDERARELVERSVRQARAHGAPGVERYARRVLEEG